MKLRMKWGWACVMAVSLMGLRGWAHGLQADTQSATSSQDQTQKSPSNPVTMTDEERADLYMARKSYDDAADYYYRALKKTGFSNAAIWNKMGIAYQEQGNLREARKAYKEAMRRDRLFAEPLNNMGTTYFLNGNAGKSVKYYRGAIKLKPDVASFHLNLGSAYYQTKKYKLAVEQFHDALTLDPTILLQHSSSATMLEASNADADYYFYLAKVFASLGRPEEAVRYLRKSMEDGFKDMKKIEGDADFKKIGNDPAYIALLKNPPVAIKD
jgi:tetratricopeptide (TPR) repeat protein